MFNFLSTIKLRDCVSCFPFKLSKDNSVKVTDVGVFKEAGTPVYSVYIAPEVFHSKVYDSKADIYSFGIILWEIWYGQQALVEVKGPTTAFLGLVDEGYGLQYVKGKKEPPRSWKILMEKCWSKDPDERPSLWDCRQQFMELNKEWL